MPAPSLVFTLNDLFPRWIPTTTSAMLPARLLGIVALLSHGTVTFPTLKRGLGCYEDENLGSVPMESVARSSRPRTVSDPRKAARSRGRNRFRSGFERLAVFYGFSRIPMRQKLSSSKKWVDRCPLQPLGSLYRSRPHKVSYSSSIIIIPPRTESLLTFP